MHNHHLTPREIELIQAMCAGHVERSALAKALQISPTTVRTHLGNIYLKLGVRGATELVLYVLHQPALRAQCFPQIKVWRNE